LLPDLRPHLPAPPLSLVNGCGPPHVYRFGSKDRRKPAPTFRAEGRRSREMRQETKTMTRMRFRVLRNAGLALAAAGVLAAGVAQAQEGMGRGHGRFGGIRRALAALDLNDTQKTQIKGFFQEAKPAFQSLREQMRSNHQALHDAVNVDRPDPTAVRNAFLKVHADREAMKAQR